MKKIFILLAAACMMLSACGQTSLKPWTKGGFDTHKYRNVFAEMGYSQKEIGAILGCTAEKVKSRMRQARVKLREELERGEGTERGKGGKRRG